MMHLLVPFIELIFAAGLFLNAALFIPQILTLLKTKDSRSFSLITFVGFCTIQFFTILHALIHRDWILLAGNVVSLTACITLTGLIILYQPKKGK